MSDSHKRYNAITKALLQAYGTKLNGHVQSHFNTLPLLICGIVGAGHTGVAHVVEHFWVHPQI